MRVLLAADHMMKVVQFSCGVARARNWLLVDNIVEVGTITPSPLVEAIPRDSNNIFALTPRRHVEMGIRKSLAIFVAVRWVIGVAQRVLCMSGQIPSRN
jgi:hypothetical protein